MEWARGRNAVLDEVIDGAPLLGSVAGETATDLRSRQGMRRPSIRGATRFLHRASSRRVMREPSMLVREAAAEQLEERQSDWAYSRPVVFLDVIWNLAFVIVAAAVLMLSRDESPAMPLRIWIVGYAVQCVLHMVCVCSEYGRRQREMQRGEGDSGHRVSEDAEYDAFLDQPEETASAAKHLESAITMFSFIWWITGFYWVSAGGQNLIQDAPQLYWLCVVFLAFDVFFVVFCVALACVIGIAVCCCLPCIIAILYAVADQEGASEEDVRRLPKYRFRSTEATDRLNLEKSGPFGGTMTLCNGGSHVVRVISPEDAECCICLSVYDDGAELRALPCGHHFHCACIDKWLYINATCPLCKYNIVQNGIGSIEEV